MRGQMFSSSSLRTRARSGGEGSAFAREASCLPRRRRRACFWVGSVRGCCELASHCELPLCELLCVGLAEEVEEECAG